MKLKEIKDFKYTPPKNDISSTFSVEQITNGDGSVSTFYNINDGVVIEGVSEILPSTAKVYRTIEGDTLKNISWKLYNDIGYWWIIAKINKIDDAFKEFEPGYNLIVFDANTMAGICSSIADGAE